MAVYHTCQVDFFNGLLGVERRDFVEPVPEFYARMAALAEKTETALKEAGAMTNDLTDLASDIRTGVKLVEEKPAAKDIRHWYASLSYYERRQVDKLEDILMAMGAFECADNLGKNLPMEKLRKLTDDLEHGRMPADPSLAAVVEHSNLDVGELWRSLGTICRRLESLAHKQLRGVAFNKDEKQFIDSYGSKLAAVMFYRANSHEYPNDDAPRVVDVYFSPIAGKYLEVGIARPRAMYVLYPAKGGEILCRGTIMPYYEFAHDARLTDAEWQTLLDSPKRPASPAWLSPIVSPGGLSAPKFERPVETR